MSESTALRKLFREGWWHRFKGSIAAHAGFITIIALLGYFVVVLVSPSPSPPSSPGAIDPRLAKLDAVLKILGVLAALGFFVYKIHTGWLIVNLKVSVKLDRAASTGSNDVLAITLTLEKGSTDSVWIESASARVRTATDVLRTIDMSDEFTWVGFPFKVDPSSAAPGPGDECRPEGDAISEQKFDWSKRQREHGPIALSPGEGTSIARFVEVPRGSPIAVDVAVWGKRSLWARGSQWRASAVSLPLARAASAPRQPIRRAS